MSSESAPVLCVGMSFGNANSSIAYVSAEGKVEVIANEDGDRQIPSILSYTNNEQLDGQQAKAQLVRNPSNTVAYFHEFIGKEFKDIDPTYCHASAHAVKHESSVGFSIKEKTDGEAKVVSVNEITSRYLQTLKRSATNYLGEDVTHIVLSVPTNFSDAQKDTLRTIAADAGLTILQFVPEPVAALLASDSIRSPETASSPDKYVVVADFGHTRSDISLIASRGGIYTVLATIHDYETSGVLLDKVIIDLATKEFLKRNPGASDPRENTRSLAKLTSQCDQAKKALSVRPSAAFSVEALIDGLDFAMTIDRTSFEIAARSTFRALTGLVEKCIEKAGFDVLDISEVLLIGGTSNVPRIFEQIQVNLPESVTVLDPAAPSGVVNPYEAIARGAAIQASLISEYDQKDIDESSSAVVTAVPHTSTAIGIVGEGDKFVPIIQEHTSVPVRKTFVVGAPAEGGDVFIRLSEGKRDIKVTLVPVEKIEGEEEFSDEEPEEEREVEWTATKPVAEAVVRGVKKGSKVEVQVLVSADFSVQIQARETGAQGGVRGTVPAHKA